MKEKTALDALCSVLIEKLEFSDTERDMVLLQHKFGIDKNFNVCMYALIYVVNCLVFPFTNKTFRAMLMQHK